MTAGISYVAALGRLLIAVIFLVSGVAKILAPEMTLAYFAPGRLPAALVDLLVSIAIAIELGGGILLVLGFLARPVAVVMAIFCVATAAGFHHDLADQNQLIHFLKNIAMAGGFLQIVAFGAGALSLDALPSIQSLIGE
jgi:putative oxidoreductase